MRRLSQASALAGIVALVWAHSAHCQAPDVAVPVIPSAATMPAEPKSDTLTPKCDTVTTVAGDRYSGPVLGISADGWAKLAGPQFKAEVEIALAAVESINFFPAKTMEAGPTVTLTDGDRIMAQVTSMTPERTTVTTPAFGTLSFATASVAEIRPSNSATESADVTFESGNLGPFKAVKGKWEVREGHAVYSGGEAGDGVLSLRLAQTGDVTFVIEFGVRQTTCTLNFLSGQENGQPGITFSCSGSGGQINLYGADGAVTASHAYTISNPDENNITLRVAYDAGAHIVHAWVGQYGLSRHSFQGPKGERFVGLSASGPVSVRRIRVIKGIETPDGNLRRSDGRPAAAPAAAMPRLDSSGIQVTLANGDTLSSKSVTWAEGRLVVQSEFGEMRVAPDKVALVRFPRREEASAAGAPALSFDIQTSQGRLTLRSFSLTDETFAGRSDLLGDISFKRDILASVRVRHTPAPKQEGAPPAGTAFPAPASNITMH